MKNSDLIYEIFMLGKRGVTDAALAAALQAMAQVVGQQHNAGGGEGVRMLETFLRNHPPTFKGRYDPDGAQTWLKEVERIFRLLQPTCACQSAPSEHRYTA